MNGGGKFLLNFSIPLVKHEIEIHNTLGMIEF